MNTLRPVILIFCMLFASAAVARDLVMGRGWLEDPTGAMIFEEARRGTFEPCDGVLARDTTDAGQGPNVLRMYPVYLDEVTVFDSGPQDWNVPIVVENEPGYAGFPDPFYMSPSAKRVSGPGLGLLIVHDLGQRTRCAVTYAPSPSRVRFVATFPAAEAMSCNR